MTAPPFITHRIVIGNEVLNVSCVKFVQQALALPGAELRIPEHAHATNLRVEGVAR